MTQRRSKKKQEDDGRMNWMSSTQLWCNNSSTTTASTGGRENKSSAALHGSVRGPSPPSTADTTPPQLSLLPLAAFSAAEKQAPPQPAAVKPRRCWSPELHQRFVDALEQLGGAKGGLPGRSATVSFPLRRNSRLIPCFDFLLFHSGDAQEGQGADEGGGPHQRRDQESPAGSLSFPGHPSIQSLPEA